MTDSTFEPMDDERTEREIRRFLEWDTDAIAGAPTPAEMIGRLEWATRTGAGRRAASQWSPTFRVVIVTGLLAALLAGAFAVGALLNKQQPVVSVPSRSIGLTGGALRGQVVSAGTWYVDVLGVRVSFDLPDGWEHGWSGDLNYLSPGKDLSALLLATSVTNVFETPCGAARIPEVGPTVDDLVAALTELQGLGVTVPVDATVDGYRGKQLSMHAPAALEGCIDSIPIWTNGGLERAASYLDFSEDTSIWVLDVDGWRIVLRTIVLPETTPQERAATQTVFDSIRIEPRISLSPVETPPPSSR